ncbi:hypothetical protein LguiB_013234 [Lonicera macranthoides]
MVITPSVSSLQHQLRMRQLSHILYFPFVFYHSMEPFSLCMLFDALIMEQFSDHV